MYAVVLAYGKQYKLFENQIFKIDKINLSIGEEIKILNVLFLFKNDKSFLGKPYIDNCNVKLSILNHFRGEKINIIKFKRRKHHMKKMGHRQWYTEVKVLSINSDLC